MEKATTRRAQIDEGPQAFDRFRDAMKAILTVPKSAMPPSPFKKHPAKKKATSAKKRPAA